MLDILKKIADSYRNIERWIAYRTYDKYHVIHLGTKPGFSDSREMLLHANFAVLIHFVEGECAGMNSNCKDFAKSDKSGLGVDYLNQYIALPKDFHETFEGKKDINQEWREHCREIKELYIWWKFIRPDRPDPYQELWNFDDVIESQGRRVFYLKNGRLTDDLTEDERAERDEINKRCWDRETQQEQEDQNMLHRLIDVRFFLWT